MPTYDMVCDKCGKQVEVFRDMNSVVQCECGAVLRTKVSGGTATLYKCAGFKQYKGRNTKI